MTRCRCFVLFGTDVAFALLRAPRAGTADAADADDADAGLNDADADAELGDGADKLNAHECVPGIADNVTAAM